MKFAIRNVEQKNNMFDVSEGSRSVTVQKQPFRLFFLCVRLPVLWVRQKEKSPTRGLFSFWWTRPVTVHSLIKRYMDSLAITGARMGMARITIKRFIRAEKEVFCFPKRTVW